MIYFLLSIDILLTAAAQLSLRRGGALGRDFAFSGGNIRIAEKLFFNFRRCVIHYQFFLVCFCIIQTSA